MGVALMNMIKAAILSKKSGQTQLMCETELSEI